LAVRFEWDEEKLRANIVKHKADFADVPEMFQGPMMVQSDLRNDYGEDRQVGYGLIKNRVMVAVFTEPQPDVIRVISLRKASKYEQEKFEKALRNRLGSH
jgi:hypothetical protein